MKQVATDGIKKAGVMGWPVHHSLSPALHGFWLSHHGIPGLYMALPVEPAALTRSLKALPEKGFAGVNLTVPHKEAAMQEVDELDEAAQKIGAINTVVVKEGKLLGKNTDAYGFITNLKQQHPKLNTKKAVVLGAGGAARAIVYALRQEGFAQIIITNRTEEKAKALAKEFHADAGSWVLRESLLADASLLVNTTTLGMRGADPLNIDLSTLPEDCIVSDIVYAPLVTDLLEAAKTRGNPVVEGLGMLLHQAVPCFEAWFGIRPEVTPELKQYVLSRMP